MVLAGTAVVWCGSWRAWVGLYHAPIFNRFVQFDIGDLGYLYMFLEINID